MPPDEAETQANHLDDSRRIADENAARPLRAIEIFAFEKGQRHRGVLYGGFLARSGFKGHVKDIFAKRRRFDVK